VKRGLYIPGGLHAFLGDYSFFGIYDPVFWVGYFLLGELIDVEAAILHLLISGLLFLRGSLLFIFLRFAGLAPLVFSIFVDAKIEPIYPSFV